MSSTVDRIEKSKTSVCLESVSKTRSKVNAPAASLDYDAISHARLQQLGSRADRFYLCKCGLACSPYVDAACILSLEVYYRLSSTC